MFKKKLSAAIDIGSTFLKVIEVEGFPKKPKITRFGMESIAPHAIVDGEVMDREVVIDTIRALVEKTNLTETEVVSAVSGRDVIIKKIKMTKMNESEAEEQVKWEAEQYIPYGIEDVVIDFEIINPDAGGDMMELLLVGAKKDAVESRLSLLREAGLNPSVLEIPIFAVQNAYEYNYEIDNTTLIGLVHIGAQFTSISFVQGTINHFARDIPVASNTLMQALQRELGINRDRAFEIISGKNIEDIDRYSYQNAMQSFQDDLAIGIERVLPYLPEGFDKLDKIVLSGGGALISGIHEFLNQRFGVTIETLDPLRKFEIDEDAYTGDLTKISPLLAMPIGLTLRGEG